MQRGALGLCIAKGSALLKRVQRLCLAKGGGAKLQRRGHCKGGMPRLSFAKGGLGGGADVVRCHRGARGCCVSAVGGVQTELLSPAGNWQQSAEMLREVWGHRRGGSGCRKVGGSHWWERGGERGGWKWEHCCKAPGVREHTARARPGAGRQTDGWMDGQTASRGQTGGGEESGSRRALHYTCFHLRSVDKIKQSFA